MAIQFQCPSCSQPLEVDDEWASKPVACPYCRNTVTVPAESTYEVGSTPPIARPTADAPLYGHVDSAVLGGGRSPSALGTWALVLACSALALYIAMNIVIGPEMLKLAGPEGSMREAQEKLADQINSGSVPGWIATACVGSCLIFGVWVAAVACGIMALRRPGPRGRVIAALVVCGVLGLLAVGGALLGAVA